MTNSVLWFSGGKDSLACLYLLREQWGDGLTVLHVDTGAKLPEVAEYIDGLRAVVPNFMVVKSNQRQWIADHGLPVDVLPVAYSGFGQFLSGEKPIRMQPYVTCCENNLWKELRGTTKLLGATKVFHGSKQADAIGNKRIGAARLGGVEYESLIDGWSDHDVMRYLEDSGAPVPPWFVINNDTSMDCWDCTAFMRGASGRVSWLKSFHADKYREFTALTASIRQALNAECSVYEEV